VKAVIMAAGKGLRLGQLTYALPKALIPVAGRPLIHYMLDLCEKSHVDEIFVVGGFEFFRLQTAIEKWQDSGKTPIRLLNNKDYHKGNLLTLACALPHMQGDFFVSNVDHIYPLPLLEKFLKSKGELTVAADFDRPLGMDDMKIRFNGKKRLTDISKKLITHDGGYIGMTRCSKSFVETYKRAVEGTFHRFGTQAVAENVLQTLILWNEAPTFCDLSGFGWHEVDTPEERFKAEQALS